jgi:hypothetical protein
MPLSSAGFCSAHHADHSWKVLMVKRSRWPENVPLAIE